MSVENGELEQALHAWRVADVPLPLGETNSQYAPVLQGFHGQEGLVSKDRFGPTRYELPNDPDTPIVIGDEQQEAFLVASGKLRHCTADLQRGWTGDSHMRAVLERNLGEYGSRAYTRVILEMPHTAVMQHRASVAYFAAKFCVEPLNEAPELIVSLWDNGRQYSNASELRRLWTNDGVIDLDNPDVQLERPIKPVPGLSSRTYPAYAIARHAAKVFNGSLTVISNEHRLDISSSDKGYRIRQSTVEPITGNVVIARMPILPKRIRKDHDGQLKRTDR